MPIQPGEVIDSALMNQLARGADQGRMMAASGGATVQMVGSVVGIGMNFPDVTTDRDILVLIRKPKATTPPAQLGAGFYYGSTYNQPNIFAKTSATTLTIENPIPHFNNCVVMNLAESSGVGHALSQDTYAICHFIGWTAPNANGVSLPLLAARIGDSTSLAFLVTSDATAGSTYRRYNAKSITNGTVAASEDIIVENGAEPVSIFASNQLLVSPNTLTFGVEAAGQVNSVDTGTGKRVVISWIGFASCDSSPSAIDGSV